MKFNGQLLSGDEVIANIENNAIVPIVKNKQPLYLERGGEFITWLESRAIDRHRPNSRILKKVLRLTDTSDLMTVIHANAATITDNYWIRETGSTLAYDDVKFRENIFADIALIGNTQSFSREFSKEQLSSKTPELTNIGSFEKCWKLENDGWVMYKKGSKFERFSELFISKLGKKFGFDMAEYYPEGEYIKTPDFTEDKYNFEPMASLVGEDENYVKCYDVLHALNPEFARQYLDILYMDTICINMDRHTNNFGLLRDRETGELVKMAPNFDNNIALISRGYLTKNDKPSPMLAEMFSEFLQERDIEYAAPKMDESMIREIAIECDVNKEIDIDYVVKYVTALHEICMKKAGLEMGAEQKSGGMEMKF